MGKRRKDEVQSTKDEKRRSCGIEEVVRGHSSVVSRVFGGDPKGSAGELRNADCELRIGQSEPGAPATGHGLRITNHGPRTTQELSGPGGPAGWLCVPLLSSSGPTSTAQEQWHTDGGEVTQPERSRRLKPAAPWLTQWNVDRSERKSAAMRDSGAMGDQDLSRPTWRCQAMALGRPPESGMVGS